MTYSAADFSDDVMSLAADLGVISQDYAENEDLADNEEPPSTMCLAAWCA